MPFGFVWWIAVWFWPSPLNGDSAPVWQLLAVMGLVHLLGGILVYWQHPENWNLLLLLYVVTSAIHWAGPLGDGEGLVGTILLSLYVVLGIALFSSVFVHLALAYPHRKQSRLWLGVIYSPVLLAIAVAVLVIVGWAERGTFPLLFLIGSVAGFAAGLIWLHRLWIGKSVNLAPKAASLVTLALLIGWLPNMLVQYQVLDLGQSNGLVNLSLLITLAAFLWLAQKV